MHASLRSASSMRRLWHAPTRPLGTWSLGDASSVVWSGHLGRHTCKPMWQCLSEVLLNSMLLIYFFCRVHIRDVLVAPALQDMRAADGSRGLSRPAGRTAKTNMPADATTHQGNPTATPILSPKGPQAIVNTTLRLIRVTCLNTSGT